MLLLLGIPLLPRGSSRGDAYQNPRARYWHQTGVVASAMLASYSLLIAGLADLRRCGLRASSLRRQTAPVRHGSQVLTTCTLQL